MIPERPLDTSVWMAYTETVLKKFSKFIALFLLLWTAMDLCIPSLCRAEDVNSELRGIQITAQKQDAQASQTSVFHDDDDCFCCCSHIRPSAHFAMSAALLSVQFTSTIHYHQIDRYPRSLFHPPRS